jgi:hypothetical protein
VFHDPIPPQSTPIQLHLASLVEFILPDVQHHVGLTTQVRENQRAA